MTKGCGNQALGLDVNGPIAPLNARLQAKNHAARLVAHRRTGCFRRLRIAAASAALPSKIVGAWAVLGNCAPPASAVPIGGRSAINGRISESRIGGSHVRCADVFTGSTGVGRWLFLAPIDAVDLHSTPGQRIAEGVF